MMDKERFSEILRTTKLEGEHLDELDGLIRDYPWFGLPRFLRLKAHEQLQQETERGELNKAAVFSSDRKQLYAWVMGQIKPWPESDGMEGPDIEFLEQDEDTEEIASVDDPGTIGVDPGGEVFELDEEGPGENDHESENDLTEEDAPEGREEDADNKPIPEKTEIEMEDPEIEEPEAIPVIDPLDDEDIPSVEEEGAQAEQGGHQPDQENISMAELMEEGISNPAEQDIEPEVETGKDQTEAAKEENESTGRVEGSAGTDQSASDSEDLIERFLRNEPGVIKADRETKLEGDMSEGSVKEDDSFITDTLAKIYVKQGLHAKAIYAYERLSLKYPEKSAYFAAQIEKIKNNSNV